MPGYNKILIISIFILCCIFLKLNLKSQTLALTPPMGWNSWNLFEFEVSDSLLREIAEAMVSSGMKDAGYQYIIIDDHWVGGRNARNVLFPDPNRFPNGMKTVADFIHSKGLKLGIYSDAAEYTCGGVAGSFGFEELDARTFAEWGIDYLKYDYCNAPDDLTTAFQRYRKMGDALEKTGRPIVYSICEWGQRKPWQWAKAAGGHLWRTTWDSRDVWKSGNNNLTGIIEIFDQQKDIGMYAGPGGWNDPDMLMIGLYGKGKSSSVNGRFQGCNDIEYESQFNLWVMLSAPLIVNFDIRKMNDATRKILLNKEVIAINQDSLGKQANTLFVSNDVQVLRKDLKNGDIAICIFNRAETSSEYNFKLKRDLNIWFPSAIRDLSNSVDIRNNSYLEGFLMPHQSVIYRISKKLKQKKG